jgi:hypothetical protein
VDQKTCPKPSAYFFSGLNQTDPTTSIESRSIALAVAASLRDATARSEAKRTRALPDDFLNEIAKLPGAKGYLLERLVEWGARARAGTRTLRSRHHTQRTCVGRSGVYVEHRRSGRRPGVSWERAGSTVRLDRES